MKVSDCEMSLDFQIRGRGYCSTSQCRHTALRWQGPPPGVRCCTVLLFCKPSGPYSTEQGRPFTLAPTRLVRPLSPAAVACPGTGWGGAGHAGPDPCTQLLPASTWQLGGHTPSWEQMPQGRFPLTQSVPSPEEDQGEGSETPSACSGPQILRAVVSRAGLTGSTQPRA